MRSDAIKEIAKQLQSPEVKERRQAIITLGKSKNPDAIKFLNWSVRNEDQEDLRKLASAGIKYIRDAQNSQDKHVLEASSSVENTKILSSVKERQSTIRQEPGSKRIEDRMLIQDIVLLTITFLFFTFQLNIATDYFIRLDKVELSDGSTVSDRIDMIKFLFSMYEYTNEEIVSRQIDTIHGRLDIRDVRNLYTKSKNGASMIIKSPFLYDVFLKDQELFPDEPMAEVGIGYYSGEQPLFSKLLNASTFMGAGVGIFTIMPLLAMLPIRAAWLFQMITTAITLLGMRLLWVIILLVSLANLGIYIYFYTNGIVPFLYDMLSVLNMRAHTIRVRDVVDGQFFFIFFVWGIIATIALASILFRPYEKLETDQP